MYYLIKEITITSLILACLGTVMFLYAEPNLTNAVNVENQFTISQVVSAEIAFSVPGSNITMSPTIDGWNGGTADGHTQVVVKTNNHNGYSMTLVSASSLGMIGVASSTSYIPAYVPVTIGVPDFTFTTPANTARFGYSITASTTADVDASFLNDNANCGIGVFNTYGKCWLNASTTAETVINRSAQTAASGSTTTISFRVIINPQPLPIIPDDIYVATTTLTAFTN